MKKSVVWFISVALVLFAVAAVLVMQSRAGVTRAGAVRAAPKAGGVHQILSAQPFVVAEPWTHAWRKERPRYDAGWLVVLEVDPALVEPRDTKEPVLYAGLETVERINHGFESGRVVAIVPSKRGASGLPALDLARTPFWFGSKELPERIDARAVRAERDAAQKLGVETLEAPAPLELLRLDRRDDLDAIAALLILEHAPAEQDLATGMLVPRLK